MDSSTKFLNYPDQDPRTRESIEIGGEKYKKYQKKYGTPKIKSPKTGRRIGVNKTEYKKLLNEGYSQHELLYGKLEKYPVLPEEIVNNITEKVNLSSKRLINKKHLKYEFPEVETLPKELVDEILINTNTPVKRLINKQYMNEEEKIFRRKVHKKIYNYVKRNDDFATSDYSELTREEWKDDQWEQILKLSDKDIHFLNMLMDYIEDDKIKHTNDDYSFIARINGFILDEGKIILTEY